MNKAHQHAVETHCAALGLLALTLLGCPNVTPSEVVITDVVVKGDVRARNFQLELSGHGFGLSRVRYDFSKGTGTSSTSVYAVELVPRLPTTPKIQIPSAQVSVESTTRIDVAVDLDAPLQGGLNSPYDVVLFIGDRTVTKAGALVVIEADAGAPDAAEPPDSGDAGDPPDV